MPFRCANSGAIVCHSHADPGPASSPVVGVCEVPVRCGLVPHEELGSVHEVPVLWLDVDLRLPPARCSWARPQLRRGCTPCGVTGNIRVRLWRTRAGLAGMWGVSSGHRAVGAKGAWVSRSGRGAQGPCRLGTSNASGPPGRVCRGRSGVRVRSWRTRAVLTGSEQVARAPEGQGSSGVRVKSWRTRAVLTGAVPMRRAPGPL